MSRRPRALPLAVWPFALSLACSAEPASHTTPAPPPVTAPQSSVTAVAVIAAEPSTACAACHAEIAREWESSQHRHSASDPSYMAAVAREPAPFCRKCHAPSSNPFLPTPAAERERGTGCMDCHVGLRPEHATTHAAPPARACAGCHEFDFQSSRTPMQKTATEHARSAFAEMACSDCHMTAQRQHEGDRTHRDHRFAITPEMLRRALDVDVAPAGPSRVAFRLRAGAVGHAFPTGDLFRRLVVTSEALDDEGEAVARVARHLSRHFESVPLGNGTFTRRDALDDRVGASLPPCFELDVGARGNGRVLRIEIAYERVDEPRTARDDDAVVSSRVLLLQRTLPNRKAEAPRPCR